VTGQREHVGRLKRHVEGVGKVLDDFDTGDHGGDLGPDVHRAQRKIAPVGAECAKAGVGYRPDLFGCVVDGQLHGCFLS
jgi:hypothetical protein